MQYCLTGILWLAAVVPAAAEPLHTRDGKYEIARIEITAVYFVPRDRRPLPDWEARLGYCARRLEQFHQREFQGQSRLSVKVHPQPLVSTRDSSTLRNGNADHIFYETLRECESRLGFARRPDAPYPILLVFSDINWRELDDFYRLRGQDGQFEGNLTNGRHFPGCVSGGARSLYQPQRGLAWGLVSADGWRVPYSGSDCVVYHEGIGHPVGLPHPEPGDDSVMSQAQYRFWLNQTWIDDAQKRELGWTPPSGKEPRPADLFTTFTAIPQPLVPKPGEAVALRCTWPAAARVRHITVRVQTELFGSWCEIPVHVQGPAPEQVELARWDRPTPVSYRIEATLDDGQQAELWGYFQVRNQPDESPRPAVATEAPAVGVRWNEAVELLPKIDPQRDRVAGQWELRDGKLESSKQYGARIEIPYQPPEEYVLTAVVEPLDEPNALNLGQVSQQHRFQVMLNFQATSQPPASALENLDGKNFDGNETAYRGPLLAKDRISQVVCTVRRNEVTVSCDGRSVIRWQGDAARLSLNDYWKTPHAECLYLGAYDCRYRIHRLTLAPITGNGKDRAGAR